MGTMNKTSILTSLAIASAVASGLLLAPTAAFAERPTRVYEPVVRNRVLYVKKRLELAPLFEMTVNGDFQQILGGGLKLEYHLTDQLSIGAVGVYGINLDTKLTKKIVPTLENTADSNTAEPSKTEFRQHLNKMPLHGALYVSFTPWYGKLVAFGKSNLPFDFYFQGGMSFASLTSNCASSVCSDQFAGQPSDDHPLDYNPNNDQPLNDGTKIGLYFGGGIHVFLSEFIALDLTVRDYWFSDNPSGADFNADTFVSSSDSRFLHHLFAGVGISIMLPASAKRTP